MKNLRVWGMAGLLGLGVPAAGFGATEPVTAPASPSPVTGISNDFRDVSDFGQLDLDALLNASVVTASKKSEPISKAPAIIEVMTRKQLYDLGARDLYTALSYLPGVELVDTYSGDQTLVFRGQMQEQYNVKVLLLINGHPSYEPVNSSFYLELIPLEAIDHIEVIRGPGSVLYGTNAVAGVINVITVTRKEPGTQSTLRGQAGQFTTYGGGLGNVGKKGDLAWGIFGGGSHGRGWPYRVLKTQNEDCTTTSPLGAAGPPRPYDCNRPGKYSGTIPYFNNYESVFGDLQYSGLRLQVGALQQSKEKLGIISSYRFTGTNDSDHMFGDLAYRHEWSKFSLTARGGYDRNHRQWNIGVFPLPNAGFLETHTDNTSTVARAELRAAWTLVDGLLLDQGVSWEQGDAPYFDFIMANGKLHPLSPRFDNPVRQTSASWYGQATWNITPELTAVAGLRVTRFQTSYTNVGVSSVGTPLMHVSNEDPILNTSPRGSLIWAPRDTLVFKILYGEAFRVPNMFETNAVLKSIIGASPNLKPETIRTAELGVDSRPAEWLSLRANVYDSRVFGAIGRRNLISADEELRYGIPAGIYSNLANTQVRGLEISTQAVVNESFTFFANAAYKKTWIQMIHGFTEASGPLRRPRPAPWTGNGGLAWKAASWLQLKPNAQYVGPRGYAKAYTLLNAVVDMPVREGVTLSLIANNLLDTAYENPEYIRRWIKTLPGPGRSFYGRVIVDF